MNTKMELAEAYVAALQAEVTRLEAEELKLHASLAESVLHAQAGWARYENANNLVKGYQTELAELRAKLTALEAQKIADAAYAAGQRDMLERCVSVVNGYIGADPITDKLKELLNEQH